MNKEGSAPPPGSLTLVTGATALYAASAAGGESLFLLGETAAPPPTIALADTWSDKGAASRPGWFVAVAAPVTPAGAAAVEAILRGHLTAGTTSSFTWAAADGTPLCVVATALDAGGMPCVAADVTLPTPAGMLALSFPKAAPLRAETDSGLLSAIGCGAAPGTIAAPPPGAGASIRIAGEAAGCVTFRALIGDPPGPDASVALMNISIDPLRPFDPARSYQRFTGTGFGFAQGPAGWQLVAEEV